MFERFKRPQKETRLTPESKEFKELEEKLKKLPEVQAGKGLWQNNFHEFDVYDHTLSFVKHIKELTTDPEIIVAGYLHDIGKPVVKKPKIKDGKLQEKEPGKPYHKFTDHEIVGENMVREMDPELFKKYNLDQNRISKLVGAHYLPMKYIKAMRKTENFEDFKKAFKNLKEALRATNLTKESVMDMFLADQLAKGKGCTDFEELKKIREAVLADLTEGPELKEIYNLQKEMYGNKK